MVKIYLKTNKGYTIIETMIAISLFLVVIMTGITTLLNANLVHQKSQDMRSEIDNLSFVMEEISKNLRTGSQYHCLSGTDSLSDVAFLNTKKSGQNCWGIAFEAAGGDTTRDDDVWIYIVDGNGVWRGTGDSYVYPDNFIKLTPDEIVVSLIPVSGFEVLGAEASPDKQQPFVKIRLVGTITTKGVVTPFSLETSVSQRLVDL